jgi:thioredoxin 1
MELGMATHVAGADMKLGRMANDLGRGSGLVMMIWLVLALGASGCSDRGAASADDAGTSDRIGIIADEEAFDRLVAGAGDRIVVVDFYADWCTPCKLLAPILAEVAGEAGAAADFYTVNVDLNRELARRMGVSGIPNVMLIREGKVLERLRGVLPKKTYLAVIREAARQTTPEERAKAGSQNPT